MAFKGSVAIVTGGASGMGRLSCARLAEQGAKVFAMDMDEAGLASLADEYPNVSVKAVDVSNYEQVAAAVDQAQRDLGDIDRLTHCAAIMPLELVHKMPVETILRQMRINYDGTVHLVKSVLPGMLDRNRGDIISFGSIAGEVPLPTAGGYCATKAATIAFMKQVIIEHRNSDIRFLLVNPPPVNTSLLSAEKTGQKGFSDSQMERALKRGVVVEPEFILDEIEKALEKGRSVLHPGWFAKFITSYYKLFPSAVNRMLGKMT